MVSASFVVEAKDGGSSPKSTTCTVEVTVTDVNDVPPTFICSDRQLSIEPYDPEAACFYSLEFRDEVLVGHGVQRLTAEDIDPQPSMKYNISTV